MPELPEVEITRQKLQPLIQGRRILDFWTDWPRGLMGLRPAALRRDIAGRKVLGVTRLGKVLFFKFSGKPERTLALHLRMSGRLEIVPARTRRISTYRRSLVRADSPGRWVHFRWRLSGGRELRFVDPRKFGRVWYGSPEAMRKDAYLSSLGADAKALSRDEFVTMLRGQRGMVKPLLLRQDIVAGIGNILADESLWRARIHPRARVIGLDDGALNRLWAGLQRTIRAVLASGGTSMHTFRHPDGATGRYQERRLVYGRAGRPCPRCRTRLLRIVVGGRGTTICPKCQQIPGTKLQTMPKFQ